MSLTYLVQKLEKERKRIEKIDFIFNEVVKPVVFEWGRRKGILYSNLFEEFKNKTLPIFKSCITALYFLTPSTEEENREYIKTLDEKINEAYEREKLERPLVVKYCFEIGNGLINLGFRKILKEYLDRKSKNLGYEIDFIKKDVGFALKRYIESYCRNLNEKQKTYPPKGTYDASPLGQAELKFAFDEVIKLNTPLKPTLPFLNESNYHSIGVENKSILFYVSEKMGRALKDLENYIKKHGVGPLCYPNLCAEFLLGRNFDAAYTYLSMIGYLAIPSIEKKEKEKTFYIV